MSQSPTPPPRTLILSYCALTSPTRVRRITAIGLVIHLGTYCAAALGWFLLAARQAYYVYQWVLSASGSGGSWTYYTPYHPVGSPSRSALVTVASPPSSPLVAAIESLVSNGFLWIGLACAVFAVLAFLAQRYLRHGGPPLSWLGTLTIAPMLLAFLWAATGFFCFFILGLTGPASSRLSGWGWFVLVPGVGCTVLCLIDWDLLRFIRWVAHQPGIEIPPKPFI